MIKFNRDYQYKAVSPCKDCTRRSIKCHATCEEYIEFKKNLDQEREELSVKKIRDKKVL